MHGWLPNPFRSLGASCLNAARSPGRAGLPPVPCVPCAVSCACVCVCSRTARRQDFAPVPVCPPCDTVPNAHGATAPAVRRRPSRPAPSPIASHAHPVTRTRFICSPPGAGHAASSGPRRGGRPSHSGASATLSTTLAHGVVMFSLFFFFWKKRVNQGTRSRYN